MDRMYFVINGPENESCGPFDTYKEALAGAQGTSLIRNGDNAVTLYITEAISSVTVQPPTKINYIASAVKGADLAGHIDLL